MNHDDEITRAWRDVRAAREIYMHYLTGVASSDVFPAIPSDASCRSDVLMSLAGEAYERLQASLIDARAFLEDPSDRVRGAALLLLKDRWRSSESLNDTCSSLAFHDPSPIVRGISLLVLNSMCDSIIDPNTKGLIGELFGKRPLPVECKVLSSKHKMELDSLVICQAHYDSREAECHEDCGKDYDIMLHSYSDAMPYLRHHDPKYRRCAIKVIVNWWGATDVFRSVCETILRSDPTQIVRIAALHAITKVYRGSEAAGRIAKLLSLIVQDEQEDVTLRAHAYSGLFDLMDIGAPSSLRLSMIRGELRVPEDIDWQFIREVGT